MNHAPHTPADAPAPPAAKIADFIARWDASGAAERANYALFLTQLCDLLGVPQPEPTTDDIEKNVYVFERDVTFQEADGSTSIGRIDLYKRACFVLEAKQGSDAQTEVDSLAAGLEAGVNRRGQAARRKRGTAVRGTPAWDDAMIRARGQADRYARALPGSEVLRMVSWPRGPQSWKFATPGITILQAVKLLLAAAIATLCCFHKPTKNALAADHDQAIHSAISIQREDCFGGYRRRARLSEGNGWPGRKSHAGCRVGRDSTRSVVWAFNI